MGSTVVIDLFFQQFFIEQGFLMSDALAQAAGEKGRWFESQDALLEALRAEAKPGDVLLFKASHGMHLEHVATKFKEEI